MQQKKSAIERLPTVLLASVGKFLPTDDRLRLRETGRSFKQRFEQSVESASGSGWFDPVDFVDDWLRFLSIVADNRHPVLAAWNDLRFKPGNDRLAINRYRRFRAESAAAVRRIDIQKAAADADANLSTVLTAETDAPMSETTNRLRLSVLISIVVVVLFAVIHRLPSTRIRTDTHAVWIVVTAVAGYLFEWYWSAIRFRPFAQAVRTRLAADGLDDPSLRCIDRRWRRRLTAFFGFVVPTVVFACLFLLIPAKLLEWRWSGSSMICPFESPPWRYNKFRYVRSRLFYRTFAPASKFFIATDEFARCRAPFELNAADPNVDDVGAFTWIMVFSYILFALEAVGSVRTRLPTRIGRILLFIGGTACLFGHRVDLMAVVCAGYGISLVVFWRCIRRMLQIGHPISFLRSILMVPLVVMYCVLPAIPVFIIGNFFPVSSLPRIGYFRLRLWSVRIADRIFSCLQDIVWTTAVLAAIHRHAERRGIRMPLPFWSFLRRIRGWPAESKAVSPPRLLSLSILLAHLRHVYPALYVVVRRTSADNWLLFLFRRPTDGRGNLVCDIGISIAICIVDAWPFDWNRWPGNACCLILMLSVLIIVHPALELVVVGLHLFVQLLF